ncbi:hypothetical protein RUM43_008672 [Polyplax serrata]|uniref:Uncharacterized protein n=1 Tax=Polyplax serrata TaxID=468196 RepID=A0AAN8PVA9_POLSC
MANPGNLSARAWGTVRRLDSGKGRTHLLERITQFLEKIKTQEQDNSLRVCGWNWGGEEKEEKEEEGACVQKCKKKNLARDVTADDERRNSSGRSTSL